MNFVNMVSGKIGGAVSWTVDSSWGLGYWHSLPSSVISWISRNGWKAACATGRGVEWCWDNRVRQLITSGVCAFYLQDNLFLIKDNVKPRPYSFGPLRLLLAFVASSAVNYLWETKALYYPLNGAVAKGILANGAVVTLDALSIAALLKGMGGKKTASQPASKPFLKKDLSYSSRNTEGETESTSKLPKDIKKCGFLTKLIAVSWILYRCADIGLEWGNASHGLVQLNFDPTLSMWSRVQTWMNPPAVAA